MDVVGHDQDAWGDDHVHTIDIWFSRRRNCWVVERLNAEGHLVGAAHRCATREDAEHCLAEWLRAHGETHLTTPDDARNPAREAHGDAGGTSGADSGRLAA